MSVDMSHRIIGDHASHRINDSTALSSTTSSMPPDDALPYIAALDPLRVSSVYFSCVIKIYPHNALLASRAYRPSFSTTILRRYVSRRSTYYETVVTFFGIVDK